MDCPNGFIHRPIKANKRLKHEAHEELQCPLCGKKLRCYSDENHVVIELEHGLFCRKRSANEIDLRTYG